MLTAKSSGSSSPTITDTSDLMTRFKPVAGDCDAEMRLLLLLVVVMMTVAPVCYLYAVANDGRSRESAAR